MPCLRTVRDLKQQNSCRRTSIQALKRLQRETFEALVGVRSRLLALEVRSHTPKTCT